MCRDRIRRVVLRSAAAPPASRFWARVYQAAERLAALILTAGNGASAYSRSRMRDELVPGLSDVDLLIVGPGGSDPRRRWRMALLAPLRILVDEPRIHSADELAALTGRSALTYGLGDPPGEGRPAYHGPGASVDRVRMLERPGLGVPGAGLTLLRGPDRRPAGAAPAGDELLVAAWLELTWCWRLAFRACAAPWTARATDICWKVLADAAAVWLRLDGADAPQDRRGALDSAVARLPDLAPALNGALELRERLHLPPPAPVGQTISALAEISERAGRLIAASLPPGGTEVRLQPGAGSAEGTIPLGDWRALCCPPRPWEVLRIAEGEPGDSDAIVRVLTADDPTPTALVSDRMLVLPARGWVRTRLRAVQFPFSDPVSFALLAGRERAVFPKVRGWAAGDVAARAVAERGDARAELFSRSLRDGDPVLQLTPQAG